MDKVIITIPKFITHIAKTKTKYLKINGQKLFTGMNHHLRALVVRRMHAYMAQYIPKILDLSHFTPMKVKLYVYTTKNHGDVRMFKGELKWRPPKKDYVPRWDIDNLWIWIKCFQDTLVEMGKIEDDNIDIIPNSGEIEFIEVKDFEDRQLVFEMSKYRKKDEQNINDGK
tara:strand:+ start:3383 stop:3892 length:510 start_codon:yes stop_codon:yes gene_type:complete